MAYIDVENDPELNFAWKELKAEFQRLSMMNWSALNRKGLVNKIDLDRSRFYNEADLKKPHSYVNNHHKFQREFFLNLEPEERLAYFVSKTGNRIPDRATGNTALGMGVASLITDIAPAIFAWKEKMPPMMALKFMSLFMAFTAGLLAYGTYRKHQVNSDQEGAILAIQLTDYDTLKSAYNKEAKAMGRELSNARKLELDRANSKLEQAMSRQ